MMSGFWIIVGSKASFLRKNSKRVFDLKNGKQFAINEMHFLIVVSRASERDVLSGRGF